MRSRLLVVGIVVGLVAALAPVTTGSAAAPTGRPLYVTNGVSDNISVFPTAGDGTPLPPADLVPTARQPAGIVISADGRRAFVANRGVPAVTPYAVGPRGGLTALSEPEPTGGLVPFGIAVTPAADLVFTTNIDSGTVSTFAVGRDGRLKLVDEPLVTGFPSPRGVAVSPDGRFLYVGHGRPTDPGPNALVTYAIGDRGTLHEASTVFTAGAGAQLAISPDGRLLYIAGQGANSVFGFHIGPMGALTPVPGGRFPAGENTEGVAMTPDGRYLYVSSPSFDRPDVQRNVSAYAINADGSLTTLAGSPFQAGTGPVGIAVAPDGRHLYVSNFESHDLSVFTIGTGGGLREIAGSPFLTGGTMPGFQAVAPAPNQGPLAALTATIRQAGDASRFDASASVDSDGDVARFRWDFGDGTVLADGGPAPTHVYRQPGSYTVTVTVTDNENCSTRRVFTGTHTLCNGSAKAQASRRITVQP